MGADLQKVVHFGYGGDELYVVGDLKKAHDVAVLPDGRTVSLAFFRSSFEATGLLSMPPQPCLVKEVLTPPDVAALKAEHNPSGKTYMVDRKAFSYGGIKYLVSPAARGDVFVKGKRVPVLIRLPFPNFGVFLTPTWSPDSPDICAVTPTDEIYLRDDDGSLLLKDDKPLYRKHVVAIYADSKDIPVHMLTPGPGEIAFGFHGICYFVSEDAYHMGRSIELPDGTFVRPNYWGNEDTPVDITETKNPGPSIRARYAI